MQVVENFREVLTTRGAFRDELRDMREKAMAEAKLMGSTLTLEELAKKQPGDLFDHIHVLFVQMRDAAQAARESKTL